MIASVSGCLVEASKTSFNVSRVMLEIKLSSLSARGRKCRWSAAVDLVLVFVVFTDLDAESEAVCFGAVECFVVDVRLEFVVEFPVLADLATPFLRGRFFICVPSFPQGKPHSRSSFSPHRAPDKTRAAHPASS